MDIVLKNLALNNDMLGGIDVNALFEQEKEEMAKGNPDNNKVGPNDDGTVTRSEYQRKFSVLALQDSELFSLELEYLEEMKQQFPDHYNILFQDAFEKLKKVFRYKLKMIEKLTKLRNNMKKMLVKREKPSGFHSPINKRQPSQIITGHNVTYDSAASPMLRRAITQASPEMF